MERGQHFYGVAGDIGTTKMAIYLLDLTTGDLVTKSGVMNPQIAYGEDVVSRISYANQGLSYRLRLQNELIETINVEVRRLCEGMGIITEQIADFVMVGNTAMHHIVMKLPVRQLGEAPHVPAVNQAMRVPAREIGLQSAPGAVVYTPPNIAGYVGGDHVTMLLAAELLEAQGIALAMDIGTNTEISLLKDGRITCCSCASGPTFEGAHIHAGMCAVPGAIERAVYLDGEWRFSTIDGQQPVGICGSGILDVVASLKASSQIDVAGRFTDQAVNLVDHPKGGAIILVPGAHSGAGKDILVTRQDIREIQLAKAAIRAGVEALLRSTSTREDEIDHFIIAGAFGTYLHIESALQIGMLPRLAPERYTQIGNAAGVGAQEILLSTASRAAAETVLKNMSYLELTTDPRFRDLYVDSIAFD